MLSIFDHGKFFLDNTMWRTFFLSVGIALAIFGGEFLVVEKATWTKEAEKSEVQQVAGYLVDEGKDDKKKDNNDFKPEPWVPWAMLSSGAIIILYCASVPKDW